MILIIDNYDSFTYNLYDYIAQLGGNPVVKRNDAISIAQIAAAPPLAIVISPGPKTPLDAGITMTIIQHFHQTIPILGICLGYQAIGQFFGAQLIKSEIPVHGKTSLISHTDDPIFKTLPPQLQVMRYHSLQLSAIPTSALTIIAETLTGEPMAIKHSKFPLYGFQFHPESILTLQGLQLLRNWMSLLITDNSYQKLF